MQDNYSNSEEEVIDWVAIISGAQKLVELSIIKRDTRQQTDELLKQWEISE